MPVYSITLATRYTLDQADGYFCTVTSIPNKTAGNSIQGTVIASVTVTYDRMLDAIKGVGRKQIGAKWMHNE